MSHQLITDTIDTFPTSIKVREKGGKIKKYVIEIKPKKQCVEPKVQKKKDKELCL